MKFSWKDPLFRFLVIALGGYLAWYLFYDLYLSQHTNADHAMSVSLVRIAEVMLGIFGYETILETEYVDVTIKLADAQYNGVWVGDTCNGFILFALFTIFVLAYPGSWKRKLWFIPAGILAIHLINAIRVSILTIISETAPETLTFNHNYTFTILVYAFVFYLWYVWANRLSKTSIRK